MHDSGQVSRRDDQRRAAVLCGQVRRGLEAQQLLHHRQVAVVGRDVPGEIPWKTGRKRGEKLGKRGKNVEK